MKSSVLTATLLLTASLCHGAPVIQQQPAMAVDLSGWESVQKAWAQVEKIDTGSGVWNRLSDMVDRFGPRPTGSAGFNKSLNWLAAQLQADNITVEIQDVPDTPTWTRGKESLTLLHLPDRGSNINIPVLGLGMSSSTPAEGVTGEVVVVTSLDEVSKVNVKDKVVLYNYPWTGYGKARAIRSQCAVTAESYGAKAVLIRSVTGYSQKNLHTGVSKTAGIAAAAITVEDANFLHRLYNRSLADPAAHSVPRVRLNLQSQTTNTTSHNIFGTLPGFKFPNDIILIGGHFDSWDVGTGAGDDAANVFAAWEALRLIRKSGIKLKRSIRMTGWTNEEIATRGAAVYAEYIQAETNKPDGERHILAIESDFGVETPYGLTVETNTQAGKAAFRKLSLAGNATQSIADLGWGHIDESGAGSSGGDVALFGPLNVPVASFDTTITSAQYFNYHHSAADTMDVVDPVKLFQCTKAMAYWAIVASELEEPLGQEEERLR